MPRGHMAPTVRRRRCGDGSGVDSDRLARIVDAISIGAESDAATYPQRVCAVGVDLLGVSGAGLTLMTKNGLGAVWASDSASLAAEDLQFTLGEGPALDAFRSAAPALEPSLADAATRWPFFGPEARDLGVEAAFSFPLQMGVICLGALNLFRDRSGFPSDDELADALVLADVVTEDLIDLQALGALHWGPSDHLGQRARVHQATGMVSVQIDSDMSTALASIRAYAFSNEVSIFDVADKVLARTLRLTSHTFE
jgi:hypothetical protein